MTEEEISREKLVFLSNSLRHLKNTVIYLQEEINRLVTWLDKVIPEKSEMTHKE